MKESEVHNQFQQVLWYLYQWHRPFSLSEVIKDSMFHKFQTRLSELEAIHGEIATRTKVNFTNRFGRSSYYYYYEAIDRDQIKTLFYKYGAL